MHEWQAYAAWEASQSEYDRSRSVYERALDADSNDDSLWLRYTEMVCTPCSLVCVTRELTTVDSRNYRLAMFNTPGTSSTVPSPSCPELINYGTNTSALKNILRTFLVLVKSSSDG